MSRVRLLQHANALPGPSRLPFCHQHHHHLPPSFLAPALALTSKRTFLSRRRTSFWSQSYPSAASYETPLVPSLPPPAKAAPGGVLGDKDVKKERKQRYLDSLMDKAGELSLRCSILDAEGNWTAEEGRYKKSELCREYDLDPRDLRKLDSLTPNLVPLILTRKTCLLISMLHIRALIKPDRVIIFEHAGTVESEVQRRFKWHLERNVRAGRQSHEDEIGGAGEEELGLPYEHRALESIFVATANALEEEMAFTRQLVQQLLADLEDDINRENLKRLLHNSRRMVGFQSRARYVKRAVDEILESDEDLSAMYLTSRARGRPRALHDHEQLELLLESFTKQVEEIVSEIDTTVANMNSTQEITELMLDSGRNALLALDVKVSIATLGIGTGALVAGLFGMNLATQLETNPYAFIFVSSSATLIALVVSMYGLKVMRRVRRVALSGNASTSKLGRLTPPQLWDGDFPSLNQSGAGARGLLGKTGEKDMYVGDRSRARAKFFKRLFGGRGGKLGGGGGGGSWNPLAWHWYGGGGGGRRGLGMMWMSSTPQQQEPLWINRAADEARARDALRYRQMMLEEQLEAFREGQHREGGERWKEGGEARGQGHGRAGNDGPWNDGAGWCRKMKFGKE